MKPKQIISIFITIVLVVLAVGRMPALGSGSQGAVKSRPQSTQASEPRIIVAGSHVPEDAITATSNSACAIGGGATSNFTQDSSLFNLHQPASCFGGLSFGNVIVQKHLAVKPLSNLPIIAVERAPVSLSAPKVLPGQSNSAAAAVPMVGLYSILILVVALAVRKLQRLRRQEVLPLAINHQLSFLCMQRC